MARRRVRRGHEKYYSLYKKEKRGRRAASIAGAAAFGAASINYPAVANLYRLNRAEVGLTRGLDRMFSLKGLSQSPKSFARGVKIRAAGKTLAGLANPKTAATLALTAGVGAAAGYGAYRLGKHIQGKMGKDDVVYVYSRRLGRKIPISREKYEAWKGAHGSSSQRTK